MTRELKRAVRVVFLIASQRMKDKLVRTFHFVSSQSENLRLEIV